MVDAEFPPKPDVQEINSDDAVGGSQLILLESVESRLSLAPNRFTRSRQIAAGGDGSNSTLTTYTSAVDELRRRFDFALLTEHENADGDIYLRATNEAINVLVGGLNTDIESAQAAAEAAFQHRHIVEPVPVVLDMIGDQAALDIFKP